MTRWIWMPCVVVFSAYSLDYATHEPRYEVRDSTITIFDEVVGKYHQSGTCADYAAALNEAHERRNGLYSIYPGTMTWHACTPENKCVRQKI